MVLVPVHEQLHSGIRVGKELLVVLMSLELGPVYRIFMLPFKIIVVRGECIVRALGRWAGAGRKGSLTGGHAALE